MKIEATHENQTMQFSTVSELMRWSAVRLYAPLHTLRAEIGGVHADSVQVWIWEGEFDADTAICAGLPSHVAKMWQILV